MRGIGHLEGEEQRNRCHDGGDGVVDQQDLEDILSQGQHLDDDDLKPDDRRAAKTQQRDRVHSGALRANQQHAATKGDDRRGPPMFSNTLMQDQYSQHHREDRVQEGQGDSIRGRYVDHAGEENRDAEPAQGRAQQMKSPMRPDNMRTAGKKQQHRGQQPEGEPAVRHLQRMQGGTVKSTAKKLRQKGAAGKTEGCGDGKKDGLPWHVLP